jgi:arginyl-tRNA synthetase
MSNHALFQSHLMEFARLHGFPETLAKATYSSHENFQYQTSMGFGLKKLRPEFQMDSLLTFLSTLPNSPYTEVRLTGPGFISVKMRATPFAPSINPSKRVVIDYCGANVAKKMHIGHIRSMFIGDFVARVHQAAGDVIFPVNHVGDWGNQFGGLLLYLQQHPEGFQDNESLTQAYKAAQHLQKTDNTFQEQANAVAVALQQTRREDLLNAWRSVSQVSLKEAYATFKTLQLLMGPEHTQGESFYAPDCDALLEQLLALQVATRTEDGSVVCFFESQPPLVLQKSNGNFLYALYDLAALAWRQTHLMPDRIVYVVDKRQTLHFEQVFAIARQAKLVNPSVDLVHLGFGAIVGPDGKPLKTKEGDSLYLDDLMAAGLAEVAALPQIQAIVPARRQDVLNKTLIGGMKFYDLKFNRIKDYTFDWTHVLNFTGNSAPYIQNALVRMDSLFLKLGLPFGPNLPVTLDWTSDFSPLALDLLFNTHKCDEIASQMSSSYASQLLTEQTVKLCQAFHGYYEQVRVLGSPNESLHVNIFAVVANSLFRAIHALGIDWYASKDRPIAA